MNEEQAEEYDFQVARPVAPLRQRVTESIRNAIALGRYKGGTRLPERELCLLTGVSRTLVREALRQLESEGVIRVEAHRGPVVTEITPQQAIGIYQVREVLEGLAAELFAGNASEADLQALRQSLNEVRRSYELANIITRLNAKNRFYECLVRGSGNEALGRTLQMLNAGTTLLRARSLSTPGRPGASIRELEALLEALESRDAAAARAAAVSHVRKAAQAAAQMLKAEAAPPEL